MSKGIIELNDACIGLGLNGELIAQSSGYAVLDQQTLYLGNEAKQRSKLLPRWTNNQFWHQLNTDGLKNGTALIRHHADLAFAHLEQLKTQLTCDDAIMAVPAIYDKSQLGLLLGMCREAGVPIRAIVDLALISVANQASHKEALYLDAGLHNISLTTLRTDGVLRQTGHYSLLDTGIATYFDRWASLIAEQFIQSSRFDPMHDAASEQQLFDGLPGFIESISDNRALSYELDLGSVKHTTALSKDQLLSVIANVYPAIVKGIREHAPEAADFTLFVSPRLKQFPELNHSLSLIPGAEITYLEDHRVIENTFEMWDSLVSQDGSVAHVKSLSVSNPKPVSQPKAPAATHLLVGDQVFNLKTPRAFSELTIDGQRVGQTSSAPAVIVALGNTSQPNQVSAQILIEGLSLNGSPLEIGTHPLAIGDVLGFNGHQARVVAEQ